MILAVDQLSGVGVLVTRPSHQSRHFIEFLQAAGASAIPFPSIEILATTMNPLLQQQLANLDTYQILVFISTNAVEHGLKLIRSHNLHIRQQIVAIGATTAKALQQQGIRVSISPGNNFTSEALLHMPEMQADVIRDQRILIIRGVGGREHLADSLRQRGAHVEYLEVYQRRRPDADTSELITRWSQGKIHVVTVTSNEALKNLYDMLDKPGQDYLLNTTVIVPGQRCADLARQLGFKQGIEIAASATDEAMLEAVRKWHHHQIIKE
ncbi:MAG: uroporphyrinogen-III synthase [Gammaproteobacteria bacterium]|nr:MAG: uroporphyrinogen-III synthase [Gammaproteobacteria bacterium]